MPPIRLILLAVCLLVPAVARAADGSINIYLQPLPPEAARLTFAVDSLAAVSESGVEHGLELRLSVVRQPDAGRQRLMAAGRLPAGSYRGFVLRLGRAAMKGDQGEAALAVPDPTIRLDVPFVVSRGKGALFWASLRYLDSLRNGVSFAPVFTVVIPASPIVGNAGFVTNSRSNTITVFDKRLSQAVALIDTCEGPVGMALDQHRRRVIVACSRNDEIQSIDIATGEIVERSRLSPGDQPSEVGLTPDGRTLVAVNSGSSSVVFLDAASLSRQERVAVGNGPTSVLFDPAGRRGFVFNTLSNSVSVIDLAERRLEATISTGVSPIRGQFSERGDRLYVIHERSPFMTVVDPGQFAVLTRARLRNAVAAIALDRVRNVICLGSDRDPAIEFFDPNALMPLYSMRVRSGVSHLAVDVENNRLYMVSPGPRAVVVARLSDRKVDAEIDVGEAPCRIAVMGER